MDLQEKNGKYRVYFTLQKEHVVGIDLKEGQQDRVWGTGKGDLNVVGHSSVMDVHTQIYI